MSSLILKFIATTKALHTIMRGSYGTPLYNTVFVETGKIKEKQKSTRPTSYHEDYNSTGTPFAEKRTAGTKIIYRTIVAAAA